VRRAREARRRPRKIVVTPIPAGVRIDISQPRNWMYALHFGFMVLVFGFALAAFAPEQGFEVAEWLAAGFALIMLAVSVRQVLWALCSVERITVDQRWISVSLGVPVGGAWGERFLTRTRRVPRPGAHGLRYFPFETRKRPWWQPDFDSFSAGVSGLPNAPQPTLVLQAGDTALTFGEGLDEAEGARVVSEIGLRFPGIRAR